MLEGLFAHSEQWEASIGLLSSELENVCSVKGRLPLLKKLEIFVAWSIEPEHTNNTVTSVFEDAPLLTHVGLRDDHTWQFNFDWLSLIILNFQYVKHCESIFAILRETTTLVEVTLFCSFTVGLRIEGSFFFAWNACSSIVHHS